MKSDFLDKLKLFEETNRAELLAAGAVFLMVGAIASAFKGGLKASKVLDEKKKDLKDVAPGDKNTKRTVYWEMVKGVAPRIAVPVLLGGASAVCIGYSNSASRKKIATLSAAYTMASTALKEHKEKVEEVLGEAKAQQVREAVSKEHLDKSEKPKEDTDVIPTGLGTSLCYDEYTDRYFYSSADAINKAVLKLSYNLLNEMWVPLNDFYQELNLRPCKMGYDLGWSIDDVDKKHIPIYYTAILTEDTRPCLCIQFDVSLRESFKNY